MEIVDVGYVVLFGDPGWEGSCGKHFGDVICR